MLAQHAPDFAVDDVIVDAASVRPGRERDDVARAAAALRARVTYADVAVPGKGTHDPERLAAVLQDLVGTGESENQNAGDMENSAWR